MIGKILGNRYEILELIGSGGMAYVYKAKCNVLNRFVAIKILKSEYNHDTDFVSKFYIESQSAAALSNVNIVSVYDVGEEDDMKYIVMEYVEGITLKEIIQKNGLLDWNVAVNCGLQILNALDCAHKNGIVHRDIKPHNILVTNDGVLKVTDFGIAKAVNSGETKKIDENVVGSVHYISPEQAKGIMIDARSDLYSLGVVMYEMLTGKLPFDGENPVSVAIMHLNSEPVPIKDINIAVPLELSQIVKKSMSRDINLRYQNAKEMAQDLIGFKKREKNNAFTTNKNVDELAQNPINMPDEAKNAELQETDKKEEEIFKTRISDLKVAEITGNTRVIEKVSTKTAPADEENKSQVEDMSLKNEKNSENKKKKTKSEKNAIIAAVAVSVVLILAMALIFVKVFFKDAAFLEIFTGKEYFLADFTGKDISEVEEILTENKVKYEIAGYEKDISYSDDVILNQTPAGEMNIKTRGTVVKFIVNDLDESHSSGDGEEDENKVRVPSVIGQEYRQAEKKLKEMKFDCVIKEEVSEDVTEDYVIRQSPESGEKIAQGGKVTIFVSKKDNSDIVVVPKFVGMPQEQALKEAQTLGLVVKIEEESSTEAKAGTVLSQSIAIGTEIAKESKITLFIGVFDGEPENDTENGENAQNPTVSNGNTDISETTKDITVQLPQTGEQNTVTVYKDGALISTTAYASDAKNATVTVIGSGKANIVIKANGTVIYSKDIDFSN